MDNYVHKYLGDFPRINYRKLQNSSACQATFIQLYIQTLPENYRNGRGMLIPRFLILIEPVVIPAISYCVSVLMGILWGKRFRFNTEQPQCLVYVSHNMRIMPL